MTEKSVALSADKSSFDAERVSDRLKEILGSSSTQAFVRKNYDTGEIKVGVKIDDAEFLEDGPFNDRVMLLVRNHIEGEVPIHSIRDVAEALNSGSGFEYRVENQLCQILAEAMKPGQTAPIEGSAVSFARIEPDSFGEIKTAIDLCFKDVLIYVKYTTLSTGCSDPISVELCELLDKEEIEELWEIGCSKE